jgi:hypothetical protein
MHDRTQDDGSQADGTHDSPEDRVPAQEAVAETESLVLD